LKNRHPRSLRRGWALRDIDEALIHPAKKAFHLHIFIVRIITHLQQTKSDFSKDSLCFIKRVNINHIERRLKGWSKLFFEFSIVLLT